MEYKIYQIVCNITKEVYIGKTTRTLQDRLYNHQNSNDTTSKEIILRGDYTMNQIDKCETEEESIILEAFYIKNTDNCVNRYIPGRTKKEYREENKEELSEYGKKYYEENKEYFLEHRKKYYEEHRDEILKKKKEKQKEKYTCECGSTLTLGNKSRHERESKRHINFINSK